MSDHDTQTMPRPKPPQRRLIARITLVLTAAFAAWHVFASFLWISPPSELRTVVPGNALSNYMIPWFGQSWSVFAPEPINGDYILKIRAIIPDGQDAEGATKYTATEWVDASDAELDTARYNLFPPRSAILATQQSSKLMTAWKALTPEQQKVVTLGFYDGDAWLGRMQNELKKQSDTKEVTDYVVQERYTAAYATQVAYAVWGEKNVSQVQYQVSRQNIIPFKDRNNPDAVRPAPQIVNTGWRGTLVMPLQSTTDFRDTFLKKYQGVQ